MTRREDRDPNHNICDYIVNNTLMDRTLVRNQRRTNIPKTTNTVVGQKQFMMTSAKKVKAMEQLGKLLDEHIDWEKEDGAGAGKGK